MDPRAIIQGLIQRGVPANAAVALAGNMAVESGFDPSINERNPTVPGSRGGFGLMQWTGPRRREYEAFAGPDRLGDLDAQLDFLVQELSTTERGAAQAIYAAPDPATAARLVSERFLRPGVPHMERRIAETMRLAGGEYPSQPPQGQPQGQFTDLRPQPTGNALASQQPPQNAMPQAPRMNALDPAAFQRAIPQRNALMGFGAGQSPYIQG